MKNLIRVLCILLCLIGFSAIAEAQSTITESKRILIAELVTLTKTDQQIVEVTDKMLESMEKNYPLIYSQTIENREDLSAEAKKQLIGSMGESFKSFSRKFRERLPQRVNYKQFVQDSIYPIYDKYFTEKELSDLIAFYKTETGQKVVSSMPKLFEESSELSAKFLLPSLLKLVEEIIQEEFPETKNKQQSNPPPPGQKPNK